MTSHITAPGLLVLSDGPVTLAIGSEAEVTHWEFLGHLSAERLAVGELEAGLRRLGAHRVAPEEGVASVHIDDAANMGTAEETSPANTAVPGLLLEALAVTWRARMQDISDASGMLNQAAVTDLGRLSISGEPLLNELLALRRTEGSGSADEIRELAALIQRLRDRIRFGVAGLHAAGPADESELLKKALGRDGWAYRVHLLVAAEECLAADLLAEVRELSLTENAALEQDLTDRLKLILDHRREDLRLAEVLGALLQKLVEREKPVAEKLRHPATSRRIRHIVELAGPFTSMRVGTGVGPDGPGEVDGEAAPVAAAPADLDYDQLAGIFGEKFEDMLPAARQRVEEWKRTYPDQPLKSSENRFHRRFLDEASGRVLDEETANFDLFDHAALYAMSLAVLREVPVSDVEKRNAQAARLTRMIKMADRANTLVTDEAFDRALRTAQRYVADAIVALVVAQQANLNRVGVNRTAVKKIRRVIWWAGESTRVNEFVVGTVQGGALRVLAGAVSQAIR